MTLLDIVAHIPKYEFIVVSIDHSIRKNSADDIRLVKRAAKGYHLPFHTKKVAVLTTARKQRKGIEESARDLRYRALKSFQKKHQAAAIITAHHQDDQIETLIFHLIRGSDLQGLKGMEVLNTQMVFRPLIQVPKKDLLAYAKSNKLIWHEDSTNSDTTLSRNFIRHHLAHDFPASLLLQLSEQAQHTIQVFDKFLTNWQKEHFHFQGKKHFFYRQDFLNLPLYLQFYVLQDLTKRSFKLRDYSFSWLSSLYQWILKAQGQSKYLYRKKVLLNHKAGKIIFAWLNTLSTSAENKD